MSSSFFYSQVEINENNKVLLDSLKEYANSNYKQTYVLTSPLGENKYDYDVDFSLVLLIPGHKLLFINLRNQDSEEFNYYVQDFIEDLGYISDKYDYKSFLGRPRDWKRELTDTCFEKDIDLEDLESFINKYELDGSTDKRRADLLVSLLIGSINSIEKVGVEAPETILEKVKKKIVLFDGDQTRFIFEKLNKNRITIQGLAGTGKTELLLHKLKELYVSGDENKIVFTCHSKTLANNLKSRVPNFFTFMRVEEQIKWNERLWVMPSWGSQIDSSSGLYSFICNYYDIPFQRFSVLTPFSKVCEDALNYLNDTEGFEPCLDYILIDESQDFPESFFDLCEKIVKKSIYIAGDIFQNIYDNNLLEVSPDFLLNRCYRTDPKTLMFSHAVGMGLFERPALRWLSDEEWEACGYTVDKEILNSNTKYILSREPVRRFEDTIESDIAPTKMLVTSNDCRSDIIEVIKGIKENHPTVEPDDIGIVFINNSNSNYNMVDNLAIQVKNEFGWTINRGYENKEIVEGTLFVSNKFNIKGLEFPFIICIANYTIPSKIMARNTLYMTLTRSFITSYLLVSEQNTSLIPRFEEGLESVIETGKLIIDKPDPDEILTGEQSVIYGEMAYKPQIEIINKLLIELDVPQEKHADLIQVIKIICKDSTDPEKIQEVIEKYKGL